MNGNTFLKNLRILRDTQITNGRARLLDQEEVVWVGVEDGVVKQYDHHEGNREVEVLSAGYMTALQNLYDQNFEELPQAVQDDLEAAWSAKFSWQSLDNDQHKRFNWELAKAIYQAKKAGANLGALGPYLNDFVAVGDAIKDEINTG